MRLTPRQTEVLERIVDRGMTRAEVGVDLGISESTVRMHIDKIVERAELVGKPIVVLTKVWERLHLP